MVLEIDKAAEFRKLKKQHDGEEDPIIIVQRFLNIYRQLHIFNDEKKSDFDRMLLELPANIRGLFGSLPGGGLLQEYVDDLAEKAGLEASTSTVGNEEAERAKILATALAEASAQSSSATMPGMQTATAIPMSGTAKLEIGANFATDLAKALASALQNNNQTAQGEIRSMVQALGQTQLEIVKVLRGENTERKQESERLTAMLVQAQGQIAEMLNKAANSTGATGGNGETMQVITMLADSQAQIAQALSELKGNGQDNQNSTNLFELSQQQFVKAVDAINESTRQNGREIAQAIGESQQQFANMLIQQNNQRMAASAQVEGDDIKINASDYLNQLNQIADKMTVVQTGTNHNFEKTFEKTISELVKVQMDAYREVAANQARELTTVISMALKESQEISTQNLIKAIENLPQPTVVEKTITVPQPIYVQAPASPTYQAAPMQTQPAPNPVIETEQPAEESIFNFTAPYPNPEPEEEVDTLAEDALFEPAAEEEDDEPNILSGDEESTGDGLSELFSIGEDPSLNAEYIAKPKKKKKKKKKNRPVLEADNGQNALDNTDAETCEEANEIVQDDDFSLADDLPADLDLSAELELPTATDLPDWQDEAASWTQDLAEPEPTGFELPTEAVDDNPDLSLVNKNDDLPTTFDWQDPTDDPIEPEVVTDDYRPLQEDLVADLIQPQTTFEEPENDGWGFGNSDTAPTADPMPAAAQQEANQPETTAANAADQDWEWETEEAPAGEEGQDWEWEYEEVPEGEAGQEGQDWEWEYEEVPEGEAIAANDAGNKKTSNW